MTWAVASGTCDASDIARPWMPMAFDNIPLALTTRAIRSLWEQIEMMHIEASPLLPEASDAELEQLEPARLVSRLSALSPGRQARARKFIAFVLSEIEE